MTDSDILATEEQLEERLSRPSAALIADLQQVDGDLMILGVGGKMGPTLAKLAKRAGEEAGTPRRIIGVSRFSSDSANSNGGLHAELEASGIETIACDLLDPAAVAALPETPNIIFMAGRKFGSSGLESLTWAMNTHVPAIVAARFPRSRIVAFSTGNVYHLVPVKSGGSMENDPANPYGEYAQSCLGRERIFEHFSLQHGTPCAIARLNYAIDLRYGILLELAQKIWNGVEIDVTTGHVNIIWQGDANAQILRLLRHCASPPLTINITGPEIVSIRAVARRLGGLLDREPKIVGEEADDALLNNAARAQRLFGYPTVTLDQMIVWVAHWVKIGGPTFGKPTHYEERNGQF